MDRLNKTWICFHCNHSLFPCNHIQDVTSLLKQYLISMKPIDISLDDLKKFVLNPFQLVIVMLILGYDILQ